MKLRRFSTAGSRSGPGVNSSSSIDRMNALARALLLGELAQVAIAGHAQHLEAFGFNRLRQRANAQPGGVLGAEVLVDDDDGKAKFSWCMRTPPVLSQGNKNGKKQRTGAKCKELMCALPTCARCYICPKMWCTHHTLCCREINANKDPWRNVKPSGGCWPRAPAVAVELADRHLLSADAVPWAWPPQQWRRIWAPAWRWQVMVTAAAVGGGAWPVALWHLRQPRQPARSAGQRQSAT